MNAALAVKRLQPDWAAIAAVVLGVTAFAVAQGLTYPLISLVLESRDVSEGLIGLNAGAFSAGFAAVTLLIGRLTRLIAGDRLIIVGLVGCSISLTAFALLDSYWVWLLARFALGVFAGLIYIMGEAWLNAACPNALRGRVAGVYGAGMCLGFAAGPLAIPLFGADDGFAFALVAIYIAAVAFVTAILSRRTRTKPDAAPGGALWAFSRGAPLIVCLSLAFGFADIVAISVLPLYFVQSGYSESFAAISVTVVVLPTAFAQPLVGLLLDRLPRRWVTVGCGLTAAASFLTIPLIETEALLFALLGLMGAASFALYTCALTLLGEGYRGGLLVAGSAAMALAYAFGGATASTAAFAMEHTGAAAGPISAGLVLLVFAIGFARSRR